MLRQLIKKSSYEKEGSQKGPLFGHPDVHRLLKDLVKQEAEQEDTKDTLEFSKKLGNVLLKNLDDVLKTRAVWILVEFLAHDETKELIHDALKLK